MDEEVLYLFNLNYLHPYSERAELTSSHSFKPETE